MTPWLLVDITARASLILAGALVAARALRSRSAAVRHWVLTMGVAGALIVPAVTHVVPGWDPATAVRTAASAVRLAGAPETVSGVETEFAVRLPDDRSSARANQPGAWDGLAGRFVQVWAAGAAVALFVLAVGFARLAWLSGRAEPIGNATWRVESDDICRRFGLRRAPRLVRSSHPTLLVAWGWFRPVVVVPAMAMEWPADRIRIVLAHELAHVARADTITLIAAEVLRALHWFNPLAWMVARALRHESERACDDVVLGVGTEACVYAGHLVGVARELRARPLGMPAPAMAVPSSLERRIVAMMNTTLDRTRPSRVTRALAVAACLLFTIAVGAAQQTAAGISGRVLDQTGGTVPGVLVTIEDAAGDIVGTDHTDVRGDFQVAQLPPGTYTLTAQLPGFKRVVRAGIQVGAARIAEQDLTLEVGSLEESISISRSGTQPLNTRAELRSIAQNAEEAMAAVQRAIDACGTSARTANAPGVVRVGGNIAAPRKLQHVAPVYPATVAAEGVGGVVILEATVSEDGSVEGITVLREVHPQLADAAMDAVSQWKYTPTLLNCEPVPVMMTVSVRFEAK
jgi:TonB family protein